VSTPTPTYQRGYKLNYTSDATEIKTLDEYGTDLGVPYEDIPQSSTTDEVSIS